MVKLNEINTSSDITEYVHEHCADPELIAEFDAMFDSFLDSIEGGDFRLSISTGILEHPQGKGFPNGALAVNSVEFIFHVSESCLPGFWLCLNEANKIFMVVLRDPDRPMGETVTPYLH